MSQYLLIAFFALVLQAQTGTPSGIKHSTPSKYEDDEVAVAIPAGWKQSSGGHPALNQVRYRGQVVMGNSVLQADASLLLEKEGYTLALAYRTNHASGIICGRFIEAFRIPWLDSDQAWTCSLSLKEVP